MVRKVLRSSQNRSPSLRYPSTPLQFRPLGSSSPRLARIGERLGYLPELSSPMTAHHSFGAMARIQMAMLLLACSAAALPTCLWEGIMGIHTTGMKLSSGELRSYPRKGQACLPLTLLPPHPPRRPRSQSSTCSRKNDHHYDSIPLVLDTEVSHEVGPVPTQIHHCSHRGHRPMEEVTLVAAVYLSLAYIGGQLLPTLLLVYSLWKAVTMLAMTTHDECLTTTKYYPFTEYVLVERDGPNKCTDPITQVTYSAVSAANDHENDKTGQQDHATPSQWAVLPRQLRVHVLRQHGLPQPIRCMENAGGGNCLWLAIAQATNIPWSCLKSRSLTRLRISAAASGNRVLKSKARAMSTTNAWASSEAVAAVASYLRAPVMLHTPQGAWHIMPRNPMRKCIHVDYAAHHYRLALPVHHLRHDDQHSRMATTTGGAQQDLHEAGRISHNGQYLPVIDGGMKPSSSSSSSNLAGRSAGAVGFPDGATQQCAQVCWTSTSESSRGPTPFDNHDALIAAIIPEIPQDDEVLSPGYTEGDDTSQDEQDIDTILAHEDHYRTLDEMMQWGMLPTVSRSSPSTTGDLPMPIVTTQPAHHLEIRSEAGPDRHHDFDLEKSKEEPRMFVATIYGSHHIQQRCIPDPTDHPITEQK